MLARKLLDIVGRHWDDHQGLPDLPGWRVPYLASIFWSSSSCAALRLALASVCWSSRSAYVLERRALVGVDRVLADLLQPRLHGLRGDLLLVALALDHLGKQAVLAAVLLAHLVELLFERGELVVERLDGIALGSEVAGDENRRGNEVRLEAPLALQVVVRLGPGELVVLVLDLNDLARLRALHPAVGGDQVGVVLHRLGPVVHQVLIDVVGVDQRRWPECGEQAPRRWSRSAPWGGRPCRSR